MLRPSNYSPHDPEPGLDGILILRPSGLTSTEIEWGWCDASATGGLLALTLEFRV